ncbi:RNA 2',3'-cyclic phosphodiesterase [Cytobacillus sp. S13-E01]|uniref:RNA 2',3'-cyclic phosphodiesterase n=1 Tax=Cytobacillus sp. S13-E01 TaxID=3031326 RepID=UPI0023D87F79|nr:RNA 2',3'-cyclic phosphodiesterase [Cytobacillus sp. S13-E01]MDF0726479.1 RNA 2',3'-cyclic phosphodiesterase [Cytobacillus sp. S13-E01]
MTQQTHFFLALSLPQHIREVLQSFRELVEPKLPFKSWVHPQDLHITLAFLGKPSSIEQIQAVKVRLASIMPSHKAFQLELEGIGTFGKPESPRILWSGVKQEDRLVSLQKDVYRACTEVGFTLEDRPFTPHITLARRWNSEIPFKAIDKIVQPKEEFTAFIAEHIVLYQTHLKRLPKYQPLSIYPLGNKE